MSYILDALRKSDQQRRRGTAPTLLAGQATAVAPKQPAFLAYGLLAAVLVGAGMLIGWLRPWQPEQAAPVRAEQVAPKPLASPQRQPASAPPVVAPQPTPQRPLRTKPKTAGTPREAGAAVTEESAVPAPEQPVGTAADAARVRTVISMAELPLAVQQELPAMVISVHAYSGNPANRLVGINNRILREGEDLVPGLKLEQITPDGMIFGYKEYSFRRGVK